VLALNELDIGERQVFAVFAMLDPVYELIDEPKCNNTKLE